jgi:hypothetical protein
MRIQSQRYAFSEAAAVTIDQSRKYEMLKKDHPFAPPSYLQNLKLNQSLNPIPSLPDLTITRVSSNPDIFIFRNLLSEQQVHHIINYAQNSTMEYSGTKSGNRVNQRMNSYSCWIYPNQRAEEEEEEEEEECTAQAITDYMTEISSIIFISDILKELSEDYEEDESKAVYDAEPLQVVKYEVGGKFDVHHDGFNRFLTVLTYLNGVAGTWFPYAIIDEEEEGMGLHKDESEIPDMRSPEIAKDKHPGRDGLVIISDNDSSYEMDFNSQHIVRVHPGDAVAFFNYDWIVNFDEKIHDDVPRTGPLMNWRSIHSGLSTEEEKWIATNWFQMNIK